MKKNQKLSLSAIAAFVLTICFTSCQKDNQILPVEPAITESAPAAPAIDQHCLPPIPAIIQVPAGYKITWHAFATGFQIYKCLQSPTDPNVYTWTFQAPLANLYSDHLYTNQTGTHYAGPTWANLTGATVLGVKLQAATVDPTAIPWLLLQKVSTTGHGILTKTVYIQRLKTVGGLAPTTDNDAAHLNMEVQIPYTALYLFYSPI
ncbi:MAG: DUF3455 domain-containing protein [Bacteroidia bacterium]